MERYLIGPSSPAAGFSQRGAHALWHFCQQSARTWSPKGSDAGGLACAREIADAHARPPHALAAPRSADHDVFASAAVDGVVALWDLRSQHAVARFSAHACRRDPTTIAFSPCMRYLATGSEDKAAYVYDVRRAGAEDAVWKCRGARETVACVAFSPMHPQLATAGFDGCLQFYTCAD